MLHELFWNVENEEKLHFYEATVIQISNKDRTKSEKLHIDIYKYQY